MKILTIILAQTRSHELTWENFKENVLDHLGSDLAVCIGGGNEDDPYTRNAKYVWRYDPEPSDWGEAFTYMCNGNDNWKIILQLKDQLFGGIKESGHSGSGAILLFFRWFLLKNLRESGVIDEYDYFIITRSDHYYDSPHLKTFLIEDKICIPEGESYGGITDRHVVVPKKYVEQVLRVTDRIIQVPGLVYDIMKTLDEHTWNLEKYLLFHFMNESLLDKLVRFPRMMYAVRSDSAKTRWAEGEFEPDVGMVVKYPSEYAMVKDFREILKKIASNKTNENDDTLGGSC